MLGIIFGTICFIALLRVLFGWRHHGHWHRGYYGHSRYGARGFFLRRLFRRLDTGPGQEKLMLGEAQQLKETVKQLRHEWNGIRGDLATIVRDEQFDRSKVDALFRKQDEVLGKLRVSLAESAERVHGALDGKQKQELASWVERGFGPSHGYGC